MYNETAKPAKTAKVNSRYVSKPPLKFLAFLAFLAVKQKPSPKTLKSPPNHAILYTDDR